MSGIGELFISKEERQRRRRSQVRHGVRGMQRQIQMQEKQEREYLMKARRAREIGDGGNLAKIRVALKKTVIMRKRLESQLLSIELAMQMHDQVKSDKTFAETMMSISKTLKDMFQSTDFDKIEKNWELAMDGAERMEENSSEFLENVTGRMMDSELDTGSGLEVTDDEIDRMIMDEDFTAAPRDDMDREISERILRIDQELGRD
jgi:hypothetical protein